MILNDSATRRWRVPSVGQRAYQGYGWCSPRAPYSGYGVAPPGTLPGAIASCSTTNDCPGNYICSQNQCVLPTNNTLYTVNTGVISANLPITGVYTAGADQPAGPSGVASDAEIAAANRKKNMMIAGGVGAALLVGWLVFGKKRRGRR